MKCEECQYIGKCKEKSKEPNLIGCTSGIPVEKMGIRTNADRIRAMTNEELAEFLVKISFGAYQSCMVIDEDCKHFPDVPQGDEMCKKCFKEWLESEVETE